ncbi:hypothetical protein DQ354_12445 [Arthrobacter sp. AQ5-06]|nr:hypothetical protein DQ354_12445 [Arthrobacter sp. AQ5-06]
MGLTELARAVMKALFVQVDPFGLGQQQGERHGLGVTVSELRISGSRKQEMLPFLCHTKEDLVCELSTGAAEGTFLGGQGVQNFPAQ